MVSRGVTEKTVQQNSGATKQDKIQLQTEKYSEFTKIPILLNESERIKTLARLNNLAIMRHLEAMLKWEDNCIIRCEINTIRDYHRGGMGVNALNGAIISSLLDCVIAVPGVLQYPGEKAGTIELSIKIIRPLFGDSAIAEGFVTKKTEHISFCEGFLYDESNKLCARVSGIVAKA